MGQSVSERPGIESDVVVKKKKVDDNLVDLISKKRKLDRELVVSMLSYNVISMKQLASVTGKNISTLGNMAGNFSWNEEKKCMESDLTKCYPFPASDGDGFLFVYRDKKCEDYIARCNA